MGLLDFTTFMQLYRFQIRSGGSDGYERISLQYSLQ